MDGNQIRIRHVGVALALTIALLVLPLLIVHGAGGRIEGKITDPKGAIIIGAAVQRLPDRLKPEPRRRRAAEAPTVAS